MTGQNAISLSNNGLLIDAGVLIRTLKLLELIDVGAHFPRELAALTGINSDDDAFGIDTIHNSSTTTKHNGAGVVSRHFLHAGAHVGGLSPKQRHGLALHVGSHEGTIGVIVLQERN